MMFAAGDKVLILAKTVPGTSKSVPEGTTGLIARIGAGSHVVFVSYGDNRFWFGNHEISLVSEPFLQPIMELDEIELAEKIMEGLK